MTIINIQFEVKFANKHQKITIQEGENKKVDEKITMAKHWNVAKMFNPTCVKALELEKIPSSPARSKIKNLSLQIQTMNKALNETGRQ